MKKTHLVFVYGTLLSGLRNHRCLEGTTYIGKASTLENFVMYAHSGYPAIVEPQGKDAGYTIFGEVYEVNDRVLMMLDHLEGYDPESPKTSLYQRSSIEVKINDNIEGVYVYVQKRIPSSMKRLATGNYLEFLEEQERQFETATFEVSVRIKVRIPVGLSEDEKKEKLNEISSEMDYEFEYDDDVCRIVDTEIIDLES